MNKVCFAVVDRESWRETANAREGEREEDWSTGWRCWRPWTDRVRRPVSWARSRCPSVRAQPRHDDERAFDPRARAPLNGKEPGRPRPAAGRRRLPADTCGAIVTLAFVRHRRTHARFIDGSSSMRRALKTVRVTPIRFFFVFIYEDARISRVCLFSSSLLNRLACAFRARWRSSRACAARRSFSRPIMAIARV